jgi:tRNA modification GTPase
MILERDRDTIVAIATAPGAGGISVVRISGSRALACVKNIASFLPTEPESHRLFFGSLVDPLNGDVIDEVLVSYFADGRSFTGEEVVEVSCHGGDWAAQEIVMVLCRSGARMAERGEFSYRAFMNGKMDLVQAEGILALTQSRSRPAARAAIRQLKGRLSEELLSIRDGLLWVAANLEANLDFAHEDIEIASAAELNLRLKETQLTIERLLTLEPQSRYFEDGFVVAIVGRPNVGKSSLLNRLIREDRAIVSESPGTTRDAVRAQLVIEGVRVDLIDTAGLRKTADQVETLGIAKTMEISSQADLIVFLTDGTHLGEDYTSLMEIDRSSEREILVVRSKVDLLPGFSRDNFRSVMLSELSGIAEPDDFLGVSAKSGFGLEELEGRIGARIRQGLVEDAPGVLRARHAEQLRACRKAIQAAEGLLAKGESPEFVALELKFAIDAILQLLGQSQDDQVMDRVFNEFCLGK